MPSERKPSSLLTRIFKAVKVFKCVEANIARGLEPIKGASLYCFVSFPRRSREAEAQRGRCPSLREAVRDVKPLTLDAPAPETPRPPPRARFTRADQRAVLQESLETDVGDPELASGEELVLPETACRAASCASCDVDNTVSRRKSTCTALQCPRRRRSCGPSWPRPGTPHTVRKDYPRKGLRSGPRGPVLKEL